MKDERWMMSNVQGSMIKEQWTMNNDKLSMNNEGGTMKKYQRSMNSELWKINDEPLTRFND